MATGKKTRILYVIGFCLLIGCLVVAQWNASTSPAISFSGIERKQSTTITNLELLALRQKVNQIAIDYQNDCNQLLTSFLNELESNTSSDYQQAKDAVPDVIDELSGFGTCVKLCYKGAKDKVKGTNDFQEAYREIMNPRIIQPCLHANMVASDMLQDLNQLLKERYAKYSMDLAAVCGDNSYKLPEPEFARIQMIVNDISKTVEKLQWEKTFASISVALEVILVRGTCSAIVKLFAGPVARICASLSAGGICAVADGPFPVGDAIGGTLAIGGLIWTAHDIYEVTYALPEKLRSELGTGIDEMQKQLLEETKQSACDLIKGYQDSGNTLQAELIKELD